MPNVYDSIPTAPIAKGNVFDSVPTGNVYDSIPIVPLSPIQQVQLQSGLQNPENPTGQDNSFLTAMSEGGSPLAFAKNMVSLPLTTPAAVAGEIAEPIGAQLGNTIASDLTGKQPFAPGKPIIPAPADNEKGILPSLQRFASGMSTPGNVAMLGLAPESKAIQGLFMAGAAGSVPDSLQKMATAKNGAELRDAATELGLNVGMTALMGHGIGHGIDAEQMPSETGRALPSGPNGELNPLVTTAPPVENAAPAPNASEVLPPGSPKVPVSKDLTQEIQNAVEGNRLKPTAPIDTANVQVLTPDGKVDPVQTAIAKIKLDAAQESTEPTRPAPAISPAPVETQPTVKPSIQSGLTPEEEAEERRQLEESQDTEQEAAKPAELQIKNAVPGVDPDTGDVTVEDGSKFGVQKLSSGHSIAVEKHESEETGPPTFTEQAESIAQKLEGLKSGIAGGASGQIHLFGVPADLWDRAIGLAQYLIRSGGKVADAVNEAIVYIRKNFNGPFDEAAARDHFGKALNEYSQQPRGGNSEYIPTEGEQPAGEVPPTPGARPVETVKADVANAQNELNDAIKARPGTGKEGSQRQAMATAKYRNLRDELLNHPDYVAEQLKAHNDAVTEANAMLKPHNMAVRAEEFPNPADLQQKLTPEQLQRFNELSQTISNTHAELNRMPKKLVSSVHAQMQADGRLLKSPSLTELGAGRTLDRMTQALKGKIDSPKATLAERMAIGKKIADTVTGVKDFVGRALAHAQAMWKAGVEGFKHPPIDDDYRTAKKSWIDYDQRTSVENYKYAKALTAKIPLKVRRMAISVWLDAGGDENILRSQLADVPEQYKQVWKAALELTPDEKRIAGDIKAEFAAKMDDALATGLMDKGREDYGVFQRWKTPPKTGEKDPYAERKGTPGNPYARLDPRDPPFSFPRETPSYFDGIMAGGVPENLDVAHLVTLYDKAFHKSLGSRGWIAALQDAKAKDGSPVVKISGTAAKSDGAFFVDSKAKGQGATTADGRPYRAYDHFALRAWKVRQRDEAGNPIIVKGDMLIHPDYFDDVKNELETPKWMQKGIGAAALKFSAFLKASKFVGPFHVVTEALHASFHGVVPSVHGFDIDLNDPKQALLSRNMTLGFGHAREMFEDGLSSNRGIWAHVPGLGDAVVKMNNFTFNEYIPRLKMKVGLAVLDRNTARYAGKLNPEQIGELTGRQMDAAFGGQNWRLMGTNKNTLGILRLGFVAPDFLISRAKVIGQAFKPYNQEQRVFLMAQAAGVYALCRVLNATFSNNNDPHWEPNNWDSVVIGDRAYHARFIVSDAANLARDLLGLSGWHQQGIPFISGRLGVVPKTGIEAITGRDLFTGKEKQGLFATDNPALKAFSIVAQDTADWMTPMAVDGFIKGTAHGQTGAESLATSLVGVSSRPANPPPEKQSRRK